MSTAHPGFAAVASGIARKKGISMQRAKAILAAGTRRAGKAARRRNPRLNRVKGYARGGMVRRYGKGGMAKGYHCGGMVESPAEERAEKRDLDQGRTFRRDYTAEDSVMGKHKVTEYNSD